MLNWYAVALDLADSLTPDSYNMLWGLPVVVTVVAPSLTPDSYNDVIDGA